MLLKFQKYSTILILFLVVVLSSFLTHAQVPTTLPQQPIADSHNKTVLTIAINETSYPYHFVDDEGVATGLMPELWRLWAQKQNVDIKFVTLPWLETLKQVGEGRVDIHAGLSMVESRKTYLSFSEPLFPLYTHVYVHTDLSHVTNMEDLSPYGIGVVEGSAHIDMLSANFPELTQKLYLGRHDLYEAAIKQEILVFTGLEKLSSNYQQLKNMYPPHKRLRYKQGNYGVAVAKENVALLNYVEAGMAKISVSERAIIERKWLGIDKVKDSLTVGLPPDYSPYAALSPTGQPQGLFIDMWRLWAKETNTRITFVTREVGQLLTLINHNEVDVLLGYPNDWLENEQFSQAKDIYQSKAKLFINKNINNVNSINYFNRSNKRGYVGIWDKTPLKQELFTLYPDLNLKEYSTFNELLKAAELGEISAFIAHVDFMSLKLLKSNLQSYFYTLDSPIFFSSISPLVKKGNSRLIQLINDGFQQLKIEQLVSIEDRWLAGDNTYYRNLFEKVTLTPQEQEFIAQNRVIDVGIMRTLAPIEFINEKGEFAGIDRDIIDLIAERTGLNFNFVPYDTWHLLYQAMLDGEIDIVTSITPTQERSKQLLFTVEYRETPWTVLHPYHLGRQSELSNFYGKQLAIVKDYYLIEDIRKSHPLITLNIVKSREEGLRLVQQGKVDGLIVNISSATQLLKQESLVNLMISVMEGLPAEKNHFAVDNNNVELQSILNEGLLSITQEEREKIHDKWFNVDINTGLDKAIVLRVAIQATILIIVVLSIIIVWNRRLKKEINRREQLEKSMKHMATHDDLTGLANRVLLKDRLNTAIEFHQRQSLILAVLFLDLDGFKEVNDTYGHDVGDELLLIVAKRLQSCVRKSDTVVRFGGDEFVLLLTGLHTANEAAYVAEKVIELMQVPVELSAQTLQVGCSIGVSLFPEDGHNETDLLKKADSLMYQVKSKGKNHYLFNENY